MENLSMVLDKTRNKERKKKKEKETHEEIDK